MLSATTLSSSLPFFVTRDADVELLALEAALALALLEGVLLGDLRAGPGPALEAQRELVLLHLARLEVFEHHVAGQVLLAVDEHLDESALLGLAEVHDGGGELHVGVLDGDAGVRLEVDAGRRCCGG